MSYLNVCARAGGAGCDDAVEVLAGLKTVLAGETVDSDREYPCPSPTAGRWFTCRITPIQSPVGGAVASHVNISRQKISEQELSHQASHDSLTGLVHRMLFTTRWDCSTSTSTISSRSYVGGSIGVHLAAPGESVADALHPADQAMYSVKRARPGRSIPAQPDRRRPHD